MFSNLKGSYRSCGGLDDLMVSILLRYPEIATVKYNPRQRLLRFTFMILEQIDEQQLSEFCTRLVKALEAFNRLERRSPGIVSSDWTVHGKVTRLNVFRDVATLFPDEISLLVDYFIEWFNPEPPEEVGEEELLYQEEIINQSLEQLKHLKNDRWIIALREEGRVLVFDK
ncbi:MAG: hypothetical protein QHH02_08730 [Syntrophomonadaceae bacterium]|nr:hypothetical protein [Syntrophomonadaceae bacterium]